MSNVVAIPARPNAMSFDDLLQTATTLGTEAGRGKDTQVRMLMKLVEGGFLAAIDMNPNKHGMGIDDCTKIAEEYVRAQGTATMFDAKAPNQRKLVSCFRACTKLGQWPKGGIGEPLGTANRIIAMRQNMRKDPAKVKLLDDAANTLLKYARAQVRRDTLIEDKELEGMCMRKTHDLATPEQILDATRKNLLRLYQGRAAHNTALDNSPEVKDAISKLTDRLKLIAQEKRNATP